MSRRFREFAALHDCLKRQLPFEPDFPMARGMWWSRWSASVDEGVKVRTEDQPRRSLRLKSRALSASESDREVVDGH